LLLSTEVFLLAIESYLIYSLLVAEVEEKVYDMGMLRALGMEQYTLIAVLAFMSMFFTVCILSFFILLFEFICYWSFYLFISLICSSLPLLVA
jgi:hypothetical protein